MTTDGQGIRFTQKQNRLRHAAWKTRKFLHHAESGTLKTGSTVTLLGADPALPWTQHGADREVKLPGHFTGPIRLRVANGWRRIIRTFSVRLDECQLLTALLNRPLEHA